MIITVIKSKEESFIAQRQRRRALRCISFVITAFAPSLSLCLRAFCFYFEHFRCLILLTSRSHPFIRLFFFHFSSRLLSPAPAPVHFAARSSEFILIFASLRLASHCRSRLPFRCSRFCCHNFPSARVEIHARCACL